MTQRKSAVAFAQEQIWNSYIEYYAQSFAFSFIFYPPGDSVFVTSDQKNDSTVIRPCRTYPVVSFKVIELIRMDTSFTVGVVFQ